MGLLDHINPERKYNEGYTKGKADGQQENFQLFTPSRQTIQYKNVEVQHVGVQEQFPSDMPLSLIKERLARMMVNHISGLVEDYINVTDEPCEDFRMKVYRAHLHIGLEPLTNRQVAKLVEQ